MKRKEMGMVVLVATLIGFAALNVYAVVAGGGVTGFIDFFRNAGPYTELLLADLAIALSLVVAWIWRDARNRGKSPLPWAILTFATGSIGPLVYLIGRKEKS